MTSKQARAPAKELAAKNGVGFPYESDAYRRARSPFTRRGDRAQAPHRTRRFAMIARSPIERLAAFKRKRGWGNLKLYSDVSGDYTRDYVSADDADIPALNVLTRKDGTARSAISGAPKWVWGAPIRARIRAAPDLQPLWTIVDCTPEGRRKNWYPQLEYAE
jgi:predicted dithiol-disulfide oxidoreductase (DUF899 family)